MDAGKIAVVAVVTATAVPVVGWLAGALVPTAMSLFGTVVSGVGTMHAAGGVAATLQATSAALGTAKAASIGGIIGATFAGWRKS